MFKIFLEVTGLITKCHIFESPAAGWVYFQGNSPGCVSRLDNIWHECGGTLGSINGYVEIWW